MPNLNLNDEELAFAISLAKYALKKLDEQHTESHSGVDRLLISGWMVDTESFISKLEANKPELAMVSESPIEIPEA